MRRSNSNRLKGVKMRPVESSGGGRTVITTTWRRANALENNVTIFHTVKGNRRQFKSVNMKVSPNQWHTLRVDFEANRFKVLFYGKVALEATDDTFKESGAVGVWTKADSVTAFDDFHSAASRGRKLSFPRFK